MLTMTWVTGAHNNNFIATLRVAASFVFFSCFCHFIISKLIIPQGAISKGYAAISPRTLGAAGECRGAERNPATP